MTRTKHEIESAARSFIEVITGDRAQQWMVDLLVAVSLRRKNVLAPNPANALQTAAEVVPVGTAKSQ